MDRLKVLDIFAGIGGFSFALEQTGGFETVSFCEIDQPCQKVLKKHWPRVPIFDDVSTLDGKSLIKKYGKINVICGGFPCQDISVAGKQRGLIDGAGNTTRSGLWFQYKRLIGEIRPDYVIIENVAALISNGLEQVLSDLKELSYDCEWHIISARDVGACHLRKRIWIIAWPSTLGSKIELKPVKGLEGIFCDSSGKIFSRRSGHFKILKTKINKGGYECLSTTGDGSRIDKYVHRIVAEAFIGEIKDGYQINHKDLNKLNNRVENLEIVSPKENISHAIENQVHYSLPIRECIIFCKETGEEFESIKHASEKTGIDRGDISKCINGKRETAGGLSFTKIGERVTHEITKLRDDDKRSNTGIGGLDSKSGEIEFESSNSNNSGLGKQLWPITEEEEFPPLKLCSDRHSSIHVANSNNLRLWKSFASEEEKQQWWTEATASQRDWWKIESPICRMDDAVSAGLYSSESERRQRIKQLGNSIVPGIVVIIGQKILEYEKYKEALELL